MGKGVSIKLKKKDLKPFEKLQKVPFEIGGIMDINSSGLQRAAFVIGQHTAVKASQLPNYSIQYHTHPNIPSLPSDQDALEYVLKRYRAGQNKNKGDNSELFPIDALVQTISDSDLATFSMSLLEKKTQVMMIFSPEGIYILNSEIDKINKYKKEKKDKESKKDKELKDHIKSESRIYLKKRNNILTDLENDLLSNLKGNSVESQKKLLVDFQKKVGYSISKLVDSSDFFIDCDYFPWSSKEIKFKLNPKGFNFDNRSIFIKLNSN